MNILSEPLVNYVILWENRDLLFIYIKNLFYKLNLSRIVQRVYVLFISLQYNSLKRSRFQSAPTFFTFCGFQLNKRLFSPIYLIEDLKKKSKNLVSFSWTQSRVSSRDKCLDIYTNTHTVYIYMCVCIRLFNIKCSHAKNTVKPLSIFPCHINILQSLEFGWQIKEKDDKNVCKHVCVHVCSDRVFQD